MKFALCNEMFVNWPLDQQFLFIAECGYHGVELAPFSVDPFLETSGIADVRNIDATLRKNIVSCSKKTSLPISGLHWLLAKTTGFYLTSPDAQVRKKTASYFKELVHFCSDLGGEYLVLGSPLQRNLLPGVSKDQATEFAIDVLSQILPTLETNNIFLAIEPLAPSETDFLQTASETVALIKRMGSPALLTLHLDCKAMSSSEQETIADVIRNPENIPLIKTFHANDPNLQGPGFGKLDFNPILSSLKKIEFNGWIGIEPFDYSPGVERLAKESIQYLNNCLNC